MAALPAPGWLQPREFHVQVLVKQGALSFLTQTSHANVQSCYRMALDNLWPPSGTGGVVESLK